MKSFCYCCYCNFIFNYTWRLLVKKNIIFLREVKSWQSLDSPTGTNWFSWEMESWLLLSGLFPGNKSCCNFKWNTQSGESIRRCIRLNTQGTEGFLLSEEKTKFDVIYFLCVCVYLCVLVFITPCPMSYIWNLRDNCNSQFSSWQCRFWVSNSGQQTWWMLIESTPHASILFEDFASTILSLRLLLFAPIGGIQNSRWVKILKIFWNIFQQQLWDVYNYGK